MDSGKRKNDESIDRTTQNARKKSRNDRTERDQNRTTNEHKNDQRAYLPQHQQQPARDNNQQRTNKKRVTWEDQIKRK